MRKACWAWGHQEVNFQGEGSKAQVKFIHVYNRWKMKWDVGQIHVLVCAVLL